MNDRVAVWADGNKIALGIDLVAFTHIRNPDPVMDVNEISRALTIFLTHLKPTARTGKSVMRQTLRSGLSRAFVGIDHYLLFSTFAES